MELGNINLHVEKLNHRNCKTWKDDIKSYLTIYDLFEYVDGSVTFYVLPVTFYL